MDKGGPTTPNIPPAENEHRCGGSSAYFVGAAGSPFEAPAGARRLLGPGEPADGLQRTARPPRWPRPLASSFSPASNPSKSRGRAAPDPVGLPEQSRVGRRKGRRARREGGRRARPPPAFSGQLKYYQSPAPGRRITEASHCLANNVRVEGVGFGDPPWRREGFFCFFVFFSPLLLSPPRPPGVLQANPLPTSLSLPSLKSWWPSLVLRHCPLGFSLPRHRSRDCGLKSARGAAVPAPRTASSGPELVAGRRALARWFPTPERRSPLPFSPLASSSFCARWGEGGDGDASQPPPPGGGESAVGARRGWRLLPFGPALRICPCSRRSCRRRLGCLGGRLRVT